MYYQRGTEAVVGTGVDAWVSAEFASEAVAAKAVAMLNRADALNRAGKYTASARKHAEVEALPGFVDHSTEED